MPLLPLLLLWLLAARLPAPAGALVNGRVVIPWPFLWDSAGAAAPLPPPPTCAPASAPCAADSGCCSGSCGAWRRARRGGGGG